MKKILAILLSLILVFSLGACADEKDTESDIKTSETQSDAENIEASSTPSDESISSEENSSNTEAQSSTPATSSESSKKEESGKPTEVNKPAESSKPTVSNKPTHSHKYSDATCTEAKKCTCGATEGKALGHTWNKATCTMPKTCSVCKATEGTVIEHKWVDATCKSAKTCSVCNKAEGEKVDHVVDGTTCKWCKQAVPVSPTLLKNGGYTLYKLTRFPECDDILSGAPCLFTYSINFEPNTMSSEGFCVEGDWYRNKFNGNNHGGEPIYYNGKDYYPDTGGWGGGSFEKSISNNYIVVIDRKNKIEFELFSNDTLKVISVNTDSYGISTGDILVCDKK